MKDIYTTDAATFERLQAELEETPVRRDIKISNMTTTSKNVKMFPDGKQLQGDIHLLATGQTY